jgi:hypothetical protein
MFELWTLGLDMHKRMIDMQMQGVKTAQDMVDAARRSVAAGEAAQDAGQANMRAMKSWLRLWGVRD